MSGPDPGRPVGGTLSLRTRALAATLVAALGPLVVAVAILTATRAWDDVAVGTAIVVAAAFAVVLALVCALYLAGSIARPVARIAEAVERTAAGDADPIVVDGDDEIARLAETQNRLASDVDRRNRELAQIRTAAAAAAPEDGVDQLLWAAREEVAHAFGLIDAHVLRVDPETVPMEERVPGDPVPIRAELRAGEERLGLIFGHLPATRSWAPADQDLLELYGVVVGVALRNADLFARVEEQNRALRTTDEIKDDFLRGVSHNLQTPLARIRAYADGLYDETGDARARVVAEQSERLSRMVRQLLTVTRVDAGTLRPRLEVLALAPRVRRAWEALGAEDVELVVDDRSDGWLAIADGGQVDQVVWALLDNAAKYGAGAPVSVTIVPGETGELRMTVEDGGPGIGEADRARLFGRFERGSRGDVSAGAGAGDGSGLGLYVSRALCRSMGGDLVLEPAAPGRGAAFTAILPAELAEES